MSTNARVQTTHKRRKSGLKRVQSARKWLLSGSKRHGMEHIAGILVASQVSITSITVHIMAHRTSTVAG
eukprot:7209821-Prymnesium_polylepis.1